MRDASGSVRVLCSGTLTPRSLRRGTVKTKRWFDSIFGPAEPRGWAMPSPNFGLLTTYARWACLAGRSFGLGMSHAGWAWSSPY